MFDLLSTGEPYEFQSCLHSHAFHFVGRSPNRFDKLVESEVSKKGPNFRSPVSVIYQRLDQLGRKKKTPMVFRRQDKSSVERQVFNVAQVENESSLPALALLARQREHVPVKAVN